MKKTYLLIVSIVISLAVSAWTPMPSYAGQVYGQTAHDVAQTMGFAKAKLKMAQLTVNNRTGGTLYVSLSGTYSYSFATSKKGKTVFKNIKPGKYQITVRTSACGGSLTYSKSLKGNASLRTFVCRKKK